MALQVYSEAAWKAFAKSKDYKDGPLLEALKAFEALPAEPAQPRLEALDKVAAEFETLGKANKADKALVSQLATIQRAIDQEKRTLEQAAQDERDAAEEEEAARNPPLMTSKLVPLVRQARKGVQMEVLVAKAGKQSAVLLSKKAIPQGQRQMMMDFLGQNSGAKFFRGQAVWEENGLTFVLPGAPGGLDKKLRASMLEQTGMRINVRVRGPDKA